MGGLEIFLERNWLLYRRGKRIGGDGLVGRLNNGTDRPVGEDSGKTKVQRRNVGEGDIRLKEEGEDDKVRMNIRDGNKEEGFCSPLHTWHASYQWVISFTHSESYPNAFLPLSLLFLQALLNSLSPCSRRTE